jgi:hypothetical protein
LKQQNTLLPYRAEQKGHGWKVETGGWKFDETKRGS